MSKNKNHRRSFLKKLTGTALLTTAGSQIIMGNSKIRMIKEQSYKRFAANDNVQIAAIGMGIMGFNNVSTALKVPGVKLVAACDLYEGRLKRTQEVHGKEIDTTMDYKDILDRSDVDAVLISTSDHWHDKIAIEAMNKGKAVYCEKPVVQNLGEGLPVVQAAKKNNAIMQVGSQFVSNIVYHKAKELYEAGEIGDLILVDAKYDRNSANGAWQYPIPLDASKKTVDWKRFLGDAPKRDFDATRFFRWRNYQDYGTGVCGDLFVHLFSGLHLIISSNGPNKIFSTGGLRYWTDGRDVPDVMIGSLSYPKTDTHPAFNMQIRVNFADGSGGGQQVTLIGTEGAMTLSNTVKVTKNPLETIPTYGGWDSYFTFDEDNQKKYAEYHKKKYPQKVRQSSGGEVTYAPPAGYDFHLDHHMNFFNAVRTGEKVVEDAAYGFRAAAPALASNTSYFENRIVNWDPDNMKEA